MRCHRCENMMFPIDLADEGGGLLSPQSNAWRCFACGDITDPLIRLNRSKSLSVEGNRRGPRLLKATGLDIHARLAH